MKKVWTLLTTNNNNIRFCIIAIYVNSEWCLYYYFVVQFLVYTTNVTPFLIQNARKWAVMSEECDTDFASLMRNGVR